MKYIIFILVSVILIGILSCQPENEILDPKPTLELVFSSDTITFDTVFTSLGSATKRLIIKNPNEGAVNIKQIYLGMGDATSYSMTVAGENKIEVIDQVILGKDSLLVLVSVSIDPSNEQLPFVVRDSIVFMTDNSLQDIKLQSWGQNAHFIGNVTIPCDTVWKNDLPYFLTGSILVDSLCSLKVEPGVAIFASFNAYVFIKGTLLLMGEGDNRILLSGERLEEKYANIPGQWGGLIYLEGSKSNEINYTDIRNAQYGIRIGTPDNDTIPDLIIRNTRIENTVQGGIVAFTSDLAIENTLVNTSAGLNLAGIAGGHYTLDHCTFANYPINFIQTGSSVVITDNLPLDNGEILVIPYSFRMTNSIIWGSWDEEILVNDDGGQDNHLSMDYSILKTSLPIIENETNFLSVNTNDFKFVNYQVYDYTPDSLSVAIDAADVSNLKIDLFGHERDSIPDIGAIEFIKSE